MKLTATELLSEPQLNRFMVASQASTPITV